jgi:hypothetical protein
MEDGRPVCFNSLTDVEESAGRSRKHSGFRLSCFGRLSIALSTLRADRQIGGMEVKPFEMAVKDTFKLEDGTTAFMGVIETKSDFIGPCDCEIVLEGQVKASIRIDGEMIVKRKKTPHRAISTKQSIDLAAIGLQREGFLIRSKV